MRCVLPGFDGQELVLGDLERPERYADLFRILRERPRTVARGAGLSYCAASAGPESCSVSSSRFDRVLAFDPSTRRITVEPGMKIGRLLEIISSQGLYLPALPGHPSITVGGCVAFNVHGKTQHNAGHFGDYVDRLSVFHPDHGELECDRTQKADMFALTVGGMGFTGFITRITLRLIPLVGSMVRIRRHSVANLNDAVTRMQSLGKDADILYSWNNLNLRGERFGEGIVLAESFVAGAGDATWRLTGLDPHRGGPSAYNRVTTRIMCSIFASGQHWRGTEEVSTLAATAFPISGKEIYYHLFGRRGFREYQMLIPHERWTSASRELQQVIERSGVPMTLGSLKLFEGSPRNLDFSGSGVCLALDVPAVGGSIDLFNQLDTLVIRHAGVVNVSKDSRLTATVAEKVFPGYAAFRKAVRVHDQGNRIDSALRRRLNV